MISICSFCQKENAYVPLGKPRLRIYFCYSCQAEYVHFGADNPRPAFVHLYTTINGRMYRWSTSVDGKFDGEQHAYGVIWSIAEPGIPGVKPNMGVKKVKGFKNNLPTITPENINTKLKFMLLFL